MEYRIDYDRIDVADIMAQVKMKVSERPPAPEGPAGGPALPPPLPAARGWKGRAKKAARFLARPFFPILIPLYERFKFRTTLEVNLRLDDAVTKLGTTRETVKLLHNLSHNLVVELTKLKVEEEALKSKVRVLEKELEMLGKRERSIEKKVFE